MMEIPLYKQEIKASGLSQKEWYSKIYLKSEHWKLLKKAKAKEVGSKCEICGWAKKLEFHHINYRNIYDVTTSDLRILCKKHHHELHFGTNKKKLDKLEMRLLDLDSPNLEDEVLALISGLKKSLRNQRLNILIKEMRRKGINQSAINAIVALKSGTKARRIRLSRNGGRWRSEDFEICWRQFILGRQITRQVVEEFCTIYKANLRARHIRKLNSIVDEPSPL